MTNPQFYDQKNKFKRLHLRADSFYASSLKFSASALGFTGMENNEQGRSEVLKTYKLTAEILSGITTNDPAFEKFYNDEKRLRKLCLYMHMGDAQQSDKQLALLVETHKSTDSAIEICDAYGFGYAPWRPFIRGRNNPDHGIVIDCRGKDYDDPNFLEAYDLIADIYIGNHEMSITSNTRTSLEYARCFFY